MLACSGQARVFSQHSCGLRLHSNQEHSEVRILAYSRQAELYSQHSCGRLLRAVAWQPGASHKCLCWLAPGKPSYTRSIAVASCCMLLYGNQAHFRSAYGGLLSTSPWHAVACGCIATRHISYVPMLACSRQAQLYSQHRCGMLLRAVAWQLGTLHRCLCHGSRRCLVNA